MLRKFNRKFYVTLLRALCWIWLYFLIYSLECLSLTFYFDMWLCSEILSCFVISKHIGLYGCCVCSHSTRVPQSSSYSRIINALLYSYVGIIACICFRSYYALRAYDNDICVRDSIYKRNYLALLYFSRLHIDNVKSFSWDGDGCTLVYADKRTGKVCINCTVILV